MAINSNLVSITEANKNFSKLTRLVDEKGPVIFLENNKPKYVLIEYKEFNTGKIADDESVSNKSKEIMEKNKQVYDELAK